MLYGTIVEYFPDKKYGFIRPDSGHDVFFHISACEAGEAGEPGPAIRIGQPVKYEPAPRAASKPTGRSAAGKEPAKLMAKRVVLLDKPPGGTLADSDARQKSTRHARARQRKPTWRR